MKTWPRHMHIYQVCWLVERSILDGTLLILSAPFIISSVIPGRSDVKETVFWTNYFFNCEKVRREHLQDVQSMSLISALSTPADDIPPTKTAAAVSGADCDDENASQSSQNSLVPADDSSGSQAADTSGKDDGNDDDSSYIQVNSRSGIASPPCSLKSLEDLVFVNKSFAGGNK